MKSILIIETPTTCAGCPCYDYIHGVCAITYKDCELRKKAKPAWCPLKPLPHKKMPKQGEAFQQNMRLIDRWRGWDACIDEIMGETE